ncbi:MAG: polyribonucleotide nucleotidyltransferase [bacterium]
MVEIVETVVDGNTLKITTGLMAKQADGAVMVQYGDSVVLTTVMSAKEAKKGSNFFPLTVDYIEKSYAAGKIPGGFFKREGRPGEKEILTDRIIDRPIRPLFPEGYTNETQIVAVVLSADQENDPDILALIGASAALTISDIPFLGPVGAVRVGLIDDSFIVNPTYAELENSKINIVVAGTREAVTMVEGAGNEVSEETMLDAILFAHRHIQVIIDIQRTLQDRVGKEKRKVVPPEELDEAIKDKVREFATPLLYDALVVPGKLDRSERVNEVCQRVLDEIVCVEEDDEKTMLLVDEHLEGIIKYCTRDIIINQRKRLDGRGWDEIRPIECHVGILPRTHGSALFTRGETQALAIITLGTSVDEKKIDDLEGERYKRFMLHYNFPPFSVGEVKPLRSPGRREIGHGALAERSLSAVIPAAEEFPYTIRIVSDIMESNGSSSMATVCGGTLSLMDAGVPIKEPVAGIAMGLIKEGDEVAVLSDIMGMEDHYGDMDFKVAGTRKGITAFQMDVKIEGVSEDIMRKALEQAKEGRHFILDKMTAALAEPRDKISQYAPKILFVQVAKDKVGRVIGPGGKTIRGIIEQTEVKIDIDDEGKVCITSSNEENNRKAQDMILALVAEAEVGGIYEGEVKRICEFGAFVEILPGQDGLLHKSQISNHYFKRIEDEINEGDKIKVKVLEIDREGKIRLSRKELLPPSSSDDDRQGKPYESRHNDSDGNRRPRRSHEGHHDSRSRNNRGRRR